MTGESNTATGTAHELFVQELYQALHNAEGFETINVEHDVELTGRSGCAHQIDVFWHFRIAGQTYRTVIECKAFTSKVSIGRIRDFYGVLADVPNLQGIFVSLIGFQSGAKQFADHYGIALKEVREPTEEVERQGRQYQAAFLHHRACHPGVSHQPDEGFSGLACSRRAGRGAFRR